MVLTLEQIYGENRSDTLEMLQKSTFREYCEVTKDFTPPEDCQRPLNTNLSDQALQSRLSLPIDQSTEVPQRPSSQSRKRPADQPPRKNGAARRKIQLEVDSVPAH